jgi:uncharacterized membrane protein YebE (DUF533 family)
MGHEEANREARKWAAIIGAVGGVGAAGLGTYYAYKQYRKQSSLNPADTQPHPLSPNSPQMESFSHIQLPKHASLIGSIGVGRGGSLADLNSQ